MKTTVLPENILRRMAKSDRDTLGKGGRTADEAQAVQSRVTERDVHKQISNWLRLHDIAFAHNRMDKKSTAGNGWPDYVFCMTAIEDGFRFAIPTALEVKVNGKKLDADQERVKAMMIANGWTYHVVSSLQEVREIVKL